MNQNLNFQYYERFAKTQQVENEVIKKGIDRNLEAWNRVDEIEEE